MTGPAGVTRERQTPGKERRIFVMLGAPGAGKGTQALRLARRLGLPHISTGDLFRSAVREGTPLGEQVRPYLTRGALVPDALTMRVIEERLALPDASEGAILDGFPRTRPQAEALDALLRAAGARVSGALYVEVDAEELIRRLSGRRVCTAPEQHVYHVLSHPPRRDGVCDVEGTTLEQRADDRPETIRARLDRQLPPMYDVVDHYADRGVLCAVRGDRSVDAVTEELLHVISIAERPR